MKHLNAIKLKFEVYFVQLLLEFKMKVNMKENLIETQIKKIQNLYEKLRRKHLLFTSFPVFKGLNK